MPQLNNNQEKQKEEKKKSLIFFILMFVLLILIVLIVYFLFFYDFSQKKVDTSPQKTSQEQEQLPSSEEKQSKTSKEEETPSFEVTPPEEQSNFSDKASFTETDLKKLASSFAERFGSYSNQSQYDNLKDLKIFMSEDMKKWAEDYIKKQLEEEYSQSYYGILSKAVTSQVEKFNPDAGQARALVKTQRIESKEGKEDKVFYQDLTLDFIKQGDSWKVDRAEWQ